MTYVSYRGIPLLCQDRGKTPIVTMENYVKWYGVQILQPNGVVETVDCDIMSDIEREFPKYPLRGDHNFHPFLLKRIAERIGGTVCWRAHEMTAGRWLHEIMDCEQPTGYYPFI